MMAPSRLTQVAETNQEMTLIREALGDLKVSTSLC